MRVPAQVDVERRDEERAGEAGEEVQKPVVARDRLGERGGGVRRIQPAEGRGFGGERCLTKDLPEQKKLWVNRLAYSKEMR